LGRTDELERFICVLDGRQTVRAYRRLGAHGRRSRYVAGANGPLDAGIADSVRFGVASAGADMCVLASTPAAG